MQKFLVRAPDGTYYVIRPDGSKYKVEKQDAEVKVIVAGAEAALKKLFDETEVSLATGVAIKFANQ
jgi:ferric-dicitrate binding protein FerR (iron transport regulator)